MPLLEIKSSLFLIGTEVAFYTAVCSVPSHYLKQQNKVQQNLNQNTTIFVKKMSFKNYLQNVSHFDHTSMCQVTTTMCYLSITVQQKIKNMGNFVPFQLNSEILIPLYPDYYQINFPN